MEMQLRIILLKTVNRNYTVHTSTSTKYRWQLIPTVLNLIKHRQKSAWHGPRVENVYKKSVTQDATSRTEKTKMTKARKNRIRKKKKKKLLTKAKFIKKLQIPCCLAQTYRFCRTEPQIHVLISL